VGHCSIYISQRPFSHFVKSVQTMLETSKDLLFITLALSALLLTAFSCWLIYYFIAIIRNLYDITKSFKEKMDMIDDILKNVKNAVSNTANYIGLAINGIDKIVDYVQKKNTRKRERKKI
jgi:mannose/fructose/N-acetylgalactosamine-specific phosphotransferase system component IID